MSDINLLPEDLKKNRKKTLKNRGDFDLNEVEFTEGEKLKKDIEIKARMSARKKVGKWFRPKINDKLKFKKNYNKINNTDFVLKADSKKNKFQKQSKPKKDFNNFKEVNKEINNKQKKNNILNSSTKSKINNQKIGKTKKTNTGFKYLINNLKGKFKKKKLEEEKKDESLDVNLLPFGSNVPTSRRIISVLIIAFILSSSVIFIIYFGYHVYKEEIMKSYSNLENELTIHMKDIKKYDNLMSEITSWQGKVEEIEDLLDKHIYWTKFFDKLEENTLPDVQFVGFAGSIDGAITIQAIAPDYQTVSKQWIRLQNADDFVKEVTITGAAMSYSGDGNSPNIAFSLTLDFVDDLFYKE